MAPGRLVYGIYPHEGIVVLRQLPDGTFIDSGNEWFEKWEWGLIEVSAGTYDLDPADLYADDPYTWIVRRPTWDQRWENEPLSVPAGVSRSDSDSGPSFRRIDEDHEDELIERVTAAGLEICLDDVAVRSVARPVFAPCGCGKRADAAISSFSRNSIAGGSYYEGQIANSELTSCPKKWDWGNPGEEEQWQDSWTLDLSDPEEVFRRLSDTNPLDEDPEHFADVLREAGLPALDRLADQLDRLSAGKDLDDEDEDEPG